MEAFTFSTAELILLSAAGVFLIIQYIYYLGIYNRIHMRNITDRKNELHFTKELPPLSVVICARNESENLRRFLPAILEQDYPQFEVSSSMTALRMKAKPYCPLLKKNTNTCITVSLRTAPGISAAKNWH